MEPVEQEFDGKKVQRFQVHSKRSEYWQRKTLDCK